MKKRLIPKKHIQKAYTKDLELEDIDLNERKMENNIDKLPDEMFQVLGQVISFIEGTNKLEGDKNEDK